MVLKKSCSVSPPATNDDLGLTSPPLQPSHCSESAPSPRMRTVTFFKRNPERASTAVQYKFGVFSKTILVTGKSSSPREQCTANGDTLIPYRRTEENEVKSRHEVQVTYALNGDELLG